MASPTQYAPAPPWYGPRIGLFYGGYFIFSGIGMPFFPVWLEGRGLTEAEIASCVAIPIALRVLLTPFAGVFADRAPSRRFAVRLFTVVSLAIFLMAWPATGYWQIMLATAISMAIYQSVMPMADALALTGVRRFGLDYGRMRFVGSATFILANLGAGAVLGIVSSEAIYWLMLGAIAAGLIVGFVLPLTPPALRALDDANRPERKPFTSMFGDRTLILVLAASSLVQASHGVAYSFSSIYWQDLGYSGPEIGSLWAIGVVCEIILFLWSGAVVRRTGDIGLIVVGTFAAIVRWALLPIDLGYAGFFFMQCLHAFTFGATYLGTQHVIARMVPEDRTASAQGFYSMTTGMLMAGITALSGPLYSAFGAFAFATMVIPAIAGLVILSLVRRELR